MATETKTTRRLRIELEQAERAYQKYGGLTLLKEMTKAQNKLDKALRKG